MICWINIKNTTRVMIMKVNDNTNITIPLRNLIAIIIAIGLAITTYFGLVEQLHEHKLKIMMLEEDLKDFQDKDFKDLYRRMGEVEDELVDPKHKH